MTAPRESKIEARFVQAVEAAGGMALKFTSPGARGVPDRLTLLHGRAVLVEFKSATGVLAPWQQRMHERLRTPAVGADVRVVASFEEADALLRELGAAA